MSFYRVLCMTYYPYYTDKVSYLKPWCNVMFFSSFVSLMIECIFQHTNPIYDQDIVL